MIDITPDHLKFSTAILRRLGEELNPHPDQGIIELVRNAYDADAKNCRIRLAHVGKKAGSLRIVDDGIGMDLHAIQDGWLVLGRSDKGGRGRTKLGRRPVGDKGLGRLAALRMGRRVTLVTRPQDQPLLEHKLMIDWDWYENARVVEDVQLSIETSANSRFGVFGTEIVIEELRSSLSKKELERLARSLLLLADPFSSSSGFNPVLDAPEYEDLAGVLRNNYFASAEFQLTAKIDNRGMAGAEVKDWSGKRLWTASHADLRKKCNTYDAPPATLRFWAFNLAKVELLPRTVSLTDLRTWLRAVGGVHFYHRGLRVYPYGDQGHDWLELNLRRAQTPEVRPSTNNSIGQVWVEDPDNRLTQKTDRSGFIEDTTFEELRSFAQDALEWMAARRLEKQENERTAKRAVADQHFKTTRKALDKAIREIPHESQRVIRDVVAHYESAAVKQVEVLKEELQLYRTLSTVGTTFAVFAHELKHPLSRIKNMVAAIEDQREGNLKEIYGRCLQDPVSMIARSADALIALPTLAMQLLERDKRQTKTLLLNDEVVEVLKMVAPFLREVRIEPETEFVEPSPCVYGNKASIQSILMNLTTNAMNAIILSTTQRAERKILFRTVLSKNRAQLHVIDNGPGIQGLTVEEIWLPGKTTTPNGTGLGLTIVKDTVTDLGGRVHAVANGELGGAEVVIEIPVAENTA